MRKNDGLTTFLGAVIGVILIGLGIVYGVRQLPPVRSTVYPLCTAGHAVTPCVSSDETPDAYAVHDGTHEPRPVTVVSTYTRDGAVWVVTK